MIWIFFFLNRFRLLSCRLSNFPKSEKKISKARNQRWEDPPNEKQKSQWLSDFLFLLIFFLSTIRFKKKKDRRIHCVCKAQRLQQSLLFLFVFVRMRRYLTKKSRNFTAHQKRCHANNEHRCHYMTLIVGLRPLGHLSSQFHLFVVGTLHFYFFITGLFEFCS